MLNSVSLNLFLTIVVISTFIYYLIVASIFFRQGLFQRASSLVKKGNDLKGTADVASVSGDLMGPIVTPQSVALQGNSDSSAEDILVSPIDENPNSNTSITSSLLIGTVADLLEHTKALLQNIADNETGTTESKELLSALFIRYPHLQNTAYPQAISFYISEATKEFVMTLRPDEVLACWKSNNKDN